MRTAGCIELLTVILLTAFVLPAEASTAGTRIEFSSLDASHPHQLSGTLYLPENATGPSPAIVLCHGTVGIDMRNEFYREPLLKEGIAVFDVDFMTGIYTSTTDRPGIDTFMPMAFAALKELRKLPTIDPKRIGIMGFSLGGAITLRSSLEDARKQWMGDGKGFAVHVGFYPVCKVFIPVAEKSSGLTGAPMIVLFGSKDSYGDGKAAFELKDLLQNKFNFKLLLVEYPGASHGFNRNAPSMTYFDPAADHHFGHVEWNAEAANDSVIKVVAFLHQNLTAR
jgi:dienelactone hydrolase